MLQLGAGERGSRVGVGVGGGRAQQVGVREVDAVDWVVRRAAAGRRRQRAAGHGRLRPRPAPRPHAPAVRGRGVRHALLCAPVHAVDVVDAESRGVAPPPSPPAPLLPLPSPPRRPRHLAEARRGTTAPARVTREQPHDAAERRRPQTARLAPSPPHRADRGQPVGGGTPQCRARGRQVRGVALMGVFARRGPAVVAVRPVVSHHVGEVRRCDAARVVDVVQLRGHRRRRRVPHEAGVVAPGVPRGAGQLRPHHVWPAGRQRREEPAGELRADVLPDDRLLREVARLREPRVLLTRPAARLVTPALPRHHPRRPLQFARRHPAAPPYDGEDDQQDEESEREEDDDHDDGHRRARPARGTPRQHPPAQWRYLATHHLHVVTFTAAAT